MPLTVPIPDPASRDEDDGRRACGPFRIGLRSSPMDAGLRQVATELGFTEGPVLLPGGDIVIVAGGALRRVTPQGVVSLYAEPGGGPNGLAIAPDGTVFVANNGGIGLEDKSVGRIERVEPDGRIRVIADDLDAPNDIVLGPEGDLWFTDPRDNWFDNQLRPGRVYRCGVEGDGLAVVHEGLQYPNGIGFDGDGRLVVAESRTGILHHVSPERGADTWVKLPAGAPDGFTFGTDGRAFVCCFDVSLVYVLDHQGAVLTTHSTGAGTWPTNCVISPDGTLFVTEGRRGRLLALDDA